MNEKKCELFRRYPQLGSCEEQLDKALEMMIAAYRRGGKLLLCGNGGSAADCEHISGELMKGFLLKRPLTEKEKNSLKADFPDEAEYITDNLQRGIAAVPLTSVASVLTAFSNDVKPDLAFAQEIFSLGRKGDLAIGISTSGNSSNVVYAMMTAKSMGLATLALTGKNSSKLGAICDCTINAPENETFKVQELHLPIYHYLCASLEAELFG